MWYDINFDNGTCLQNAGGGLLERAAVAWWCMTYNDINCKQNILKWINTSDGWRNFKSLWSWCLLSFQGFSSHFDWYAVTLFISIRSHFINAMQAISFYRNRHSSRNKNVLKITLKSRAKWNHESQPLTISSNTKIIKKKLSESICTV